MQAAFPMRSACDVAQLFSTIPCMHGIIQAGMHGMGKVLVDAPMRPNFAVMTCGDFLICAGEPGLSALHVLRWAMMDEDREWVAWCPGKWRSLVERLRPDMRIETRFAFDPNIPPADEQVQRILRHMTGDITIVPLEGTWVQWCRMHTWSYDFVSCFLDDAHFQRCGTGVLLLRDAVPVAGASSYVSYPGGIEVQVQTRDDVQGHGYATLAAAALIDICHAKGLRVTWDAANASSAAIARKLGYVATMQYEAVILPKLFTKGGGA